MNIIRTCLVPHHGVCDDVLSIATVEATPEAHGFTVRVLPDLTSRRGSRPSPCPLDAGRWPPVRLVVLGRPPRGVHALAAWLGY